MLGWMLKRGDNAPDAGEGDSSLIDQPDTPAPVFAARAFKSALFGTPSKRNDSRRTARGRGATIRAMASTNRSSETPSKPQGILLTPGTGTSKRKRVSFGHDVPGGSTTNVATIDEVEEPVETRAQNATFKSENEVRTSKVDISDDEWEEDEEYGSHDVTLDLNEPHSQSGRYWKEEFLKYHQEARAEMEKLLKYKQLAKSYAQQKDAEAIQLAQRLRDEQQKVIKMEKRIADNTSQIVSNQHKFPGEETTELLGKVAKQSALAAQYRQRVQELEGQLEERLMQRDGLNNETPERHRSYAANSSVTATQKTLTETRRELRRARSQLKELAPLRDEIFSLKTQLKKAELKLMVSEREDTKSNGGPRAQELRAQLQTAKEESSRKDEEIEQLKGDFESFRKENEAHEADTNAVLERAHTKIADLKKEVKGLKAAAANQARPHSWHSKTEQDKHSQQKGQSKQEKPLSTAGEREGGEDLDETIETKSPSAKPRTLRQKFMDDAVLTGAASPVPLTERSEAGKPRWQPFVPRSPRNREYLGEDVAARLDRVGATSVTNRVKGIVAPDLPALARSITRRDAKSGAHEQVDLLQDRFARLGGPGPNNHLHTSLVANASRSGLPPERRAAALARIEKRMAEKKKLRHRAGGHDKENVRPLRG